MSLCVLAVVLLASTACAVDLIGTVPPTTPAYAALRTLGERGLLGAGWNDALNKPLTRYDAAFMLIEPLQRLTALVEVNATAAPAPEVQRRRDLATRALTQLTQAQYQSAVSAAVLATTTFGDAIDALSPGLTRRATAALRRMGERDYRAPVMTAAAPASSGAVRVSVDPHARVETIGNPLPAPPPVGPSALMLRGSGDGGAGGGTRAVNNLEAAVDVALGHLRLYGTVSALPGRDPAALLRADSGRAMLGMRMDFGRIRELGISGMLEYHVMRSGDPSSPNTSSGAVGGIGLAW
jgi:hypothetical protein